MDTRDFSQATIEEIYDIIEKLKEFITRKI